MNKQQNGARKTPRKTVPKRDSNRRERVPAKVIVQVEDRKPIRLTDAQVAKIKDDTAKAVASAPIPAPKPKPQPPPPTAPTVVAAGLAAVLAVVKPEPPKEKTYSARHGAMGAAWQAALAQQVATSTPTVGYVNRHVSGATNGASVETFTIATAAYAGFKSSDHPDAVAVVIPTHRAVEDEQAKGPKVARSAPPKATPKALAGPSTPPAPPVQPAPPLPTPAVTTATPTKGTRPSTPKTPPAPPAKVPVTPAPPVQVPAVPRADQRKGSRGKVTPAPVTPAPVPSFTPVPKPGAVVTDTLTAAQKAEAAPLWKAILKMTDGDVEAARQIAVSDVRAHRRNTPARDRAELIAQYTDECVSA